jgi:hypothetical protein
MIEKTTLRFHCLLHDASDTGRMEATCFVETENASRTKSRALAPCLLSFVTFIMSSPPGQSPTSPAPVDPKTVNRARFELELEFVQALANPYYLHSLAQQNIFEQPAFINYLKYLLYWKEKDYARFLQ